MKRNIFILLSVFLLLLIGSTTAFAGGGKGDPQPGVEELIGSCGVPAGDYGFFVTSNIWWATYSNGKSVLKCTTHLNPDQVPPAATTVVESGYACRGPGGAMTNDSLTKVFPNGNVHLICRFG